MGQALRLFSAAACCPVKSGGRAAGRGCAAVIAAPIGEALPLWPAGLFACSGR